MAFPGGTLANNGVCKIGVCRVQTIATQLYDHHVQLFARLQEPAAVTFSGSTANSPSSSASPLTLRRSTRMPLDLWGTGGGAHSTTTAPPSWWDSEHMSLAVHANQTFSWEVHDACAVHYYYVDAVKLHEGRLVLELHDIKGNGLTRRANEEAAAPHHHMYVQSVTLTEGRHTITFGDVATVTIVVDSATVDKVREVQDSCIARKDAQQQQLQAAPPPAPHVANHQRILLCALGATEGSRAQRLLSTWGCELQAAAAVPMTGNMELLRDVVSQLLETLLDSDNNKALVLELGAEVFGQATLLLRVLRQPRVLSLIRVPEESTEINSALRRLSEILQSVVHVLWCYGSKDTAQLQLWNAPTMLEKLRSKSRDIRFELSALRRQTLLRAHTSLGHDVKGLLEVAACCTLLGATELGDDMLPELFLLFHQLDNVVEDVLIGNGSSAPIVITNAAHALQRELCNRLALAAAAAVMSSQLKSHEAESWSRMLPRWGHGSHKTEIMSAFAMCVTSYASQAGDVTVEAVTRAIRWMLQEMSLSIAPQLVNNCAIDAQTLVSSIFHFGTAMWRVVLDEQHSLAIQRVDRCNSKRGSLHADGARLARKSVSLALPHEDGLTTNHNKSRVTIGVACCLAAFLLLSAMAFKIEFLPVGFFTPFVAFTGLLMYFTYKQLAGGVQRSINSNHFEAQINSMNTGVIKELSRLETLLLEAMTEKITAAIRVVQNEASKAMSDAQQSCTSIVDRIELLDQELSRVLGAPHITERLITLMLQRLGGARNSIIGSASLLMTRDLVADMLSAIPKEVRYAVLPRTMELVNVLRLMDPRSREDLQGLQREQLRLAVNAVVVQYQSSTANLAAQLVANQRVQPLEHPLRQREADELQYDSVDDDGSTLTPALDAHYKAHSLDALQLEVRHVYGHLYAKEDNLPTMEDVRVDRRELYMPPNVVRVASSTNAKTRSRLRDESLIGASVESTDLLQIMIEERIRALLAEGCTGIGKTFYCIMMALLQNLNNGIVILLRLSDISAYFGSRVLDSGAANQTLSPRELLYISFGCNPAHRSLVDRIYFRIRLGGGRIAWIIDGHNEVFRTTNVFVRTLLNAVARACNQTTNESAPVNGDDDSDDDGDDSSGQYDDGEIVPSTHQLFSSDDLIIVTSREQIASFVSKAAHVVVFNMWSPDTAVRFVRNVLALVDASSAEALPSPPHNAAVGGVSTRLLECAEAIIRGGSLGSFSTLPLWLTMVVVHVQQHQATRNSSNDTITDLMKEFVQVNLAAAATRVEEFRTAMTHLGSDGVNLLIKRCMEKSVTTVEDGVFFVLDRNVPVESAIYHSGLVRVCVRVHKMKPIVRFVHMSFLEYFRALYFAADLPQLWTWAVSNRVPSVASNAVSNDKILHTSQDEINHFSSPDGDIFVDIPLTCMRHIYSSIDVLWLEGAQQLLDFTKTRQNPLLRKYKRTFKWKNCENQIFCGLKNVRMVKGRDYYLVLRPSSGSAMVPICCTVPNNVIVKRAVPLVDIHGSRQQSTFFVLLTDLVIKRDANQCLMLFSFLEARLAHHYGRAACFLSAPERRAYLASSQRIPVASVVPQEGVYSSKLDDLGNMGMIVYMRCAKPLLSRVRRSLKAGLQAVRLASSRCGRLLDVVLGRSRKAIFEWALYPTIMVDCWEMFQELTDHLSENRWDKLKHLFPELLIAAMTVNNTLVADALKARGAQFDLAMACKMDAANVILTHVRKVVAEAPNMADQIFFSILVESLRYQKLTTAGAVMDELVNSSGAALVANNMPMLWNLLLEPWSDRSNSNNTHNSLPSSALHWLKRRLRDIPSLSCTNSSKTVIETMVLDTFHVRNIQHAVDAKIVTVSGLLSNPKPFLRYIEAMKPHHQENATTPSSLLMQTVDCCSLREGTIVVARISFCGFSERLLSCIFSDCCLSALKSVEIDGCFSDVDNKRLCMMLSVATLDVLTIASSLIFDATVEHIIDHVSLCSLTLRHVHIEGRNVTLRSLLRRLTKVKHLAVCDTYGVSIDADDLQCVSSHVEQLDLSGMRGLSDSNIAAVVAQLPNVTSLNFTGCGELTDASVRSLQGLTTDATMLTTLNTEGCARISGDSLNSLVEHSTAACTSRAVFCLCPELEAEHQSTCRYAGEARAIPLQLVGRAFIQKVEHILPAGAVLRTDDASRGVDVSECVDFNDAALRNLIRSLQTEEDITALTLRGTSVTDDGIDAMEALSGLTKLDVTACPITAQGLARIATNHPTLTFLDLSRCQQIDDREDLSAAIRRLPLLEELVAQNVRFRSLFTNTSMHGLASLHHLTRLELRGYNDLVRDEPVIRTVCTLRKLRHVCLTEFSMSEGTASGFCQLILVVHLDLTGCRISGSNAVFDNCVRCFMTSKLLKTLVLARCTQLTDAGVVLVTQHVLLRALNIADTTNVTLSPRTVAAINASQLSSINVRNSGLGSVALAGLDERFSSSR